MSKPARSSARASVTFGDVTIEVKLFPSAVSEPLTFVQTHGACGKKLQTKLFCDHHDAFVAREAVVRAFARDDKLLIPLSDDELADLESPRTEELEIVEFVPSAAVDAVFIAKTYYLGPELGSERAYRLLFAAMDDQDAVAIGRYFAKGKDRLVMLRPYRDGLALHYLFDANEVRPFDNIDLGDVAPLAESEFALMRRIVDARWSDAFHPERHRDGYPDRVRAAVDAKAQGLAVPPRLSSARPRVVDLVEALKQTVAKGGSVAGRPRREREKEGPASVRSLPVKPVPREERPSEKMRSH